MTRGILLEHGENNKQTGCRQIRDQDVGLQGTPIFVGKAQPSYRAADLDSVVRTTVVRVVTVKDVGYVTDDALCTWIVLACFYINNASARHITVGSEMSAYRGTPPTRQTP
jgi:hypothetical protein